MLRVPMLAQRRALEVVARAGPRERHRMLVSLAAAMRRLAQTRVLRRLLLAAAARCSRWLPLQVYRGRCSARRV